MNQAAWNKAKKLVEARDGGLCLRCMAEAVDVHHRIVRGMGGTGDPEVNYGLANLISLCRQCHDHVHANPEESYEQGYLVHSWMRAHLVPVTIKPGTFWVNLTPDGEINVINQMVLF